MACEVEAPSKIDLGTRRACDNESLSKEFQYLDLSMDNPQKQQSDNGPPSKRRKLDEGPQLFERITNDLYKMLGGVQNAE